MIPVITVQNMRESDAWTIQNEVPGKALMYRAAFGIFEAVEWKGRIGILTGSGNNGGDGYALACILAERGIPCEVLRVSEKFSEDGKYYHDKAVSAGVPISLFKESDSLSEYDILVDCLLGTGFSGTVRGIFRTAIEKINASGAYVISADINSGMNGDSGRAELAVISDLTVAIGYLKTGFFLGDSDRYVKKVIASDIGIRLLREEYALLSPEKLPFSIENARELSQEEAEQLGTAGESLLKNLTALAVQEKRPVCLAGRVPFITDGKQGFFLSVK